MARESQHRTVDRLRQGLLAVLVVFLGVVCAYLFARKPDSLSPQAESDRNPLIELVDVISAGEGFQYEVAEGDRTLFHIKADRMSTSRENLFELENALIEIEREDGRVYEVTADRATYQDLGSEKQTSLRGNAVVKSDDGAEIRSDGFGVTRKGRLVVSEGPVSYRLGDDLQGTADRLEAYLKQDRYQLMGSVQMTGGPANPDFSLSCRRLIYDEQRRRVHAEGDVVLLRDGVEFRAGRLTVTLAEDSDDILFIRARWNVEGTRVSDDEFSTKTRLAAQELSLVYDEITGELRRAELDARRGGLVELETSDASLLARRLEAPHVVVDFQDDRVASAQAFGGVNITEFLLFAPNAHLMRTCSDSATAAFGESGEMTEVMLAGGVDLHQPDVHAVGDEVARSAADGATRVTGEPAQVYTERGELLAPTITYFEQGSRAEATGGVRAVLARTSGFSIIREEAEEDEPIRVTSERATWDAESSEFSFSGSVRAWQGEDFVIADELIGEEHGERLRGRGKVRTVIKSRRSGDDEATAEERGPIEVSAREFVYTRSQRLLRYTGTPVARQLGRMLRCEDLELTLDEDDEFERMICRRNVLIEDATEKRVVRGDLAIYDPGRSLLEVSGRPAVMRGPEGNEVRGSVVVYDLDSGAASVKSGMVPEIPPVEEDELDATDEEIGEPTSSAGEGR